MKTKRPLDLGSLALQDFWKSSRHWMLAAGVLLAGGGVLGSCTQYDLDERTPAGWGSSIYSWLDEQGTYTNTVRMIDDLGYHDVLAQTGSKTLFVADDAAYERFFKNNSWHVGSYEQLTPSQKKLLLYGSMIDNSIQLNNLSNVQGTPPREGECMRRFAASTPYDSVAVVTPEKMPDNPYWKPYRDANKTIVCMMDMTTVPLVQFIEKQLSNNRITNEDYDFLYNYQTNRKTGDASINGVQVEEANIKCSNGFIHKMSEVITPLPNMAELIAQKDSASDYNRLLERYCAPYPVLDRSVTTQYNYLYDAAVDTVYQKRFFSLKSQEGQAVDKTPARKDVPGQLKFDPEWNSYFSASRKEGGEGNIAEQRDMAVMLVPSNQALREYWNKGGGRVLKDYYGSWDKVPDNVLAKLINTNMLSSFLSSVPSKFSGILNDANDPMGVSVNDIDSVWLGCNGAVYLTNTVYSPVEYSSVKFPALINMTMKIIDWAIDQNQYDVYLNSLNTYYSFFIPTNRAMLEYIDPVSYGKNQTQLYRFFYDESKGNADDAVWASVWNYDPATGEVLDSIGEVRDNYTIKTQLKDVLENHIVIGNVEDGKTYYRTKMGTEIRVNNVKAGDQGMTVEGSYQVNEGQPVPVSFIYDQTEKGNGKTYVLNGQPIMSTRQTVRDVLASHEEFSKFLELMDGSGLFETQHDKRYACAGTNISLFNTYHYTIYVPTNESIQALQDAGKLSSWEKVEQFEEAGNLTAKTRDSLEIVNFLKYHIQDNALFIGAANETGDFETSQLNPTTGRFYKLTSELTDNGITIMDEVDKQNASAGNKTSHKVLTTNPALYNLMAREYQYNNADASKANMLQTTSSAVIHLIDRPLQVKK